MRSCCTSSASTRQPWSSSPCASARPMPDAAPVTTTTPSCFPFVVFIRCLPRVPSVLLQGLLHDPFFYYRLDRHAGRIAAAGKAPCMDFPLHVHDDAGDVRDRMFGAVAADFAVHVQDFDRR